jgi:hypothetical protein
MRHYPQNSGLVNLWIDMAPKGNVFPLTSPVVGGSPVVRLVLIVQMAHPRDERIVSTCPRPVDRYLLGRVARRNRPKRRGYFSIGLDRRRCAPAVVARLGARRRAREIARASKDRTDVTGRRAQGTGRRRGAAKRVRLDTPARHARLIMMISPLPPCSVELPGDRRSRRRKGSRPSPPVPVNPWSTMQLLGC